MRIRNDQMIITPFSYTTVGVNTNNLAINSSNVFINPSANSDALTGILGANMNGLQLTLVNIHTTNTLILKNNSSNSSTGNKLFSTNGADIIVSPKERVTLVYDTSISGYRMYQHMNSPFTYYNDSGILPAPVKKWIKIVTPSTGNGYSIDISSAGFTSIISCNVIAIKNNSTANLSPNVAIKSISNTAIVVNVVEGNAATVSILGINVLSGSPMVFANVSGLTLSVEVTGY